MSFPTTWEAVLAEAPDLVVVGGCDFSLEVALPHVTVLWLPARTVVVDEDAHFSRPVQRLASGVR